MAVYSQNTYGAIVYSLSMNGSEAPLKTASTRAKYFKVNEFHCHADHEDLIWINPNLVESLDLLRGDFFNRALSIRSAYRSPSYNSSLGGKGTAENSEHMYGTAADIQPTNRIGWSNSSHQWVADAKQIYRHRAIYGLSGVGIYGYNGNDTGNSYIHVDVGRGINAPSLRLNYTREIRPSFWYQWIRSPRKGERYALYLYDDSKIQLLLNSLIPGNGDPTTYIRGLLSGSTIIGIQ